MRLSQAEFQQMLELRLQSAEELAHQGVIPGQLDTLELEQLVGRIKELKHIIDFVKKSTITLYGIE